MNNECSADPAGAAAPAGVANARPTAIPSCWTDNRRW